MIMLIASDGKRDDDAAHHVVEFEIPAGAVRMSVVAIDAGLRHGAIRIDRLEKTKLAAPHDAVMGLRWILLDGGEADSFKIAVGAVPGVNGREAGEAEGKAELLGGHEPAGFQEKLRRQRDTALVSPMFVGLDAVAAQFDDHVVGIVVAVRLQDGMDVLGRFLRRDLVGFQLVRQYDGKDPVCDDGRKGEGSAAEHPEQGFVVHTIVQPPVNRARGYRFVTRLAMPRQEFATSRLV
jgi:hypothetical protein